MPGKKGRKGYLDSRALPLDPAEKKAVALYASLAAVRNEKAAKRREQQARRRGVRLLEKRETTVWWLASSRKALQLVAVRLAVRRFCRIRFNSLTGSSDPAGLGPASHCARAAANSSGCDAPVTLLLRDASPQEQVKKTAAEEAWRSGWNQEQRKKRYVEAGQAEARKVKKARVADD